MAISTYPELKDSIDGWLDRDDLVDRVDDFIALAEARHKREVRIREMITRCPIGVTNRYVNLPTDFLEGRSLRLLTEPLTFLVQVNAAHMDRVRSEYDGKPLYFTTHSQIEFDRKPEQAYSGELSYYKSLRGLSDSNSSNTLLSRAPDVYLYAALSASAPFLVDDERIPVWESMYNAAKNGINALDQKNIGVPIASVPGEMP